MHQIMHVAINRRSYSKINLTLRHFMSEYSYNSPRYSLTEHKRRGFDKK